MCTLNLDRDYSDHPGIDPGIAAKRITAELGRALAVVKVTLQVNGNSQFLGVSPQKTMGATKIKSGTNDYVGEGNPHAKFGNSGITGGGSPYG